MREEFHPRETYLAQLSSTAGERGFSTGWKNPINTGSPTGTASPVLNGFVPKNKGRCWGLPPPEGRAEDHEVTKETTEGAKITFGKRIDIGKSWQQNKGH